MPAVIDPVTGLELYELSHRWGMYTPIFPGYEEIKLERITHHAKQGVMTHKITTIFHTSTHLNAPIHLVPGAPAVGDLALQKFFGTGVVLSIPKKKWGLIEPSDLERAKPAIKAGDIVLINTGWHRKYSDSKEYFGYAPGLSKHAAEWLVKKRVKLVGVDTACIDHPLATSLGPHRNGPQIKYLLPEYKEATGREAIKDFPEWNAAHRTLLEAGIPTIENVGGDLDALGGKRCTFQGFPWKWHEGDACVIRLVALARSAAATCRLERGAGRKTAAAKSPAIKSARGAGGLQFFDLSHPWGHGMPQWPSRANLNVRVVEFHAKDGLLVQQFEGIMHRGTHMDAPIHVAENTPTADRLSAVALLRHRRRGFDPEGQVGRRHAEGSGTRRAENPEERHRDDQHREPQELRRQSRLLRLFARALQRSGGMAGGTRRQARRHRRAGARSSARHVPRPARSGTGAAASRRRVQGRDRPAHHRGLSVLGAGAQDHDDQRHSRHREYRRRYRRASPAGAARSSRFRGAGRKARAARCASSPCSIRSRRFVSKPDDRAQ